MAVVLLVFAWKGSTVSLEWTQPPAGVTTPRPDASLLLWAQPLRAVLPKMLPADREYLARFYEAMAFVLLRDGDRDEPILKTSEDFVVFHGGSLDMAIDRAKVGKYDGLDAAIDETFVNACGADAASITPELRKRLVSACGVLAWTLRVNRG